MRRAAVMLVGLAMLDDASAAAQSNADGTAEPSPEAKETARSLYQRGNERFAAGDYRGALEAFAAAHAIMGVPTTGLGLGKSQEQLGMLIEARDTLLAVARIPAADGEPESFALARRDAEANARELADRIPSVQLLVTPEKAPQPVVRIDDKRLAPELVPFPIRLNPGRHGVDVAAVGYEPQRRTIQLAERDALVVRFALLAPQAAGQPVETRPLRPAGRLLAWIGFSVAGAGLATGAVAGAVSLTAAHELKEVCNEDKTCPASAAGTRDRSLASAHVSTAGFVLAGAGLALGIAGLFLRDTVRARSVRLSPTIVPLIGPDALGVAGVF